MQGQETPSCTAAEQQTAASLQKATGRTWSNQDYAHPRIQQAHSWTWNPENFRQDQRGHMQLTTPWDAVCGSGGGSHPAVNQSM